MHKPAEDDRFTAADGTVYVVTNVFTDEDDPSFFIVDFTTLDGLDDMSAMEYSHTPADFEAFCKEQGIRF